MYEPDFQRRRLLWSSLALPILPALSLLPGCTQPLAPLRPAPATSDAGDLLAVAAAAHGLAALGEIGDLSVSYSGTWRSLVGKLQPALVDAGFRGGSQERVLLRQGLIGQAHHGPRGSKQVVRQRAADGPGEIRVWFNGDEAFDGERRDAAALVVDGYCLFLLGPMLLALQGAWQRSLSLERGPGERVHVAGIPYDCDVLRVRMAPGLGFATADRIDLCIDRQQHLTRRLRFSLNGLESTRGAVAAVDVFAYLSRHGVMWPTGFYEHLLRPFPLPVHDWRLTGLDVNRGMTPADIGGASFAGAAIAPAAAIGVIGASAAP
jgi:hypothetical protein